MKEVLLVEDDDTLRYSLKRSLELESFEVVEADCVEQALRHFSAHEFDLIVTDYQLRSDRTGLSLLEYSRENGFKPPAILMSGYRSGNIKQVAEGLGAFAFFEKPFPLQDFLDICNRAVRHYRGMYPSFSSRRENLPQVEQS